MAAIADDAAPGARGCKDENHLRPYADQYVQVLYLHQYLQAAAAATGFHLWNCLDSACK